MSGPAGGEGLIGIRYSNQGKVAEGLRGRVGGVGGGRENGHNKTKCAYYI